MRKYLFRTSYYAYYNITEESYFIESYDKVEVDLERIPYIMDLEPHGGHVIDTLTNERYEIIVILNSLTCYIKYRSTYLQCHINDRYKYDYIALNIEYINKIFI